MKKMTMLLATAGLMSSAAFAQLSMDTEFRYKHVETETKTAAAAAVTTTAPDFYVDEFELAMKGDLKDNWSYYGQVEFANSANLDYAYLTKKVMMVDGLSIKIGKFLTLGSYYQSNAKGHDVIDYIDGGRLGAGAFYTYMDHNFALSYQLDDNTTKHKGALAFNYTGKFIDALEVKLNYENSFNDVEDDSVDPSVYEYHNRNTMGVSAKYSMDMFAVFLDYVVEKTEIKPLADTEDTAWNLGGQYTFGMFTPWAVYGTKEVETATDATTKTTQDITSWELGLNVVPVKGAATWYVAYNAKEDETTIAPVNTATHPVKVDTTTISMGVIYDFDI